MRSMDVGCVPAACVTACSAAAGSGQQSLIRSGICDARVRPPGLQEFAMQGFDLQIGNLRCKGSASNQISGSDLQVSSSDMSPGLPRRKQKAKEILIHIQSIYNIFLVGPPSRKGPWPVHLLPPIGPALLVMWLSQDSLAHSLTHAACTPEVRIHIYPPISISRIT